MVKYILQNFFLDNLHTWSWGVCNAIDEGNLHLTVLTAIAGALPAPAILHSLFGCPQKAD